MDACDGAGACIHAFPAVAGCFAPHSDGAALALTDSASERSDKVAWKWKGLSPLETFGNPAAGAALTLCVVDAAGSLALSATIPAGGTCAGRNCWRSTMLRMRLD